MIQDRYKPLPQVSVCSGGCYVGGALNPTFVKVNSPAIDVMTDLERIPPATVEPQANLHARQSGDDPARRAPAASDRKERSHFRRRHCHATCSARSRCALPKGGAREREELEVRDVMTSLEDMEAIEMSDVARSEVGHIVATLKNCGRQHTLVVDRDVEAGKQTLRGIFSASQIARQLGVDLSTHEFARTFAEIEAAFAGV